MLTEHYNQIGIGRLGCSFDLATHVSVIVAREHK